MKAVQLRAALEEFATIYEEAGQHERANALRAFSAVLKGANKKRLDELVNILVRVNAVVGDDNQLSIGE